MDKKTLTALRGSIKKWEKIVVGRGVDDGISNCPLCKMYFPCEGCPVGWKVNAPGCNKTPWMKWHHHQNAVHDELPAWPAKVRCPTCKRLAKRELDFLKSLLPKAICKDKENK